MAVTAYTIDLDNGMRGVSGIAAFCRKSPRGFCIAYLCSAYNAATSPSRLRTVGEHARCSRYARAIRNRLNRMGARYSETEAGKLVAV